MIREFARWCGTVGVKERIEALHSLADALFDRQSGIGETQNCEEALLFLAADTSPKIRAALAARLAAEPYAPRRIVRLLCDDGDAIAVPLVKATRALLDDDLIDLSATGSTRLRCAIARRIGLSAPVAAALAAMGERVVDLDLLANGTAEIAPSTLRAIATTHGEDGAARDLMLKREALPADIRQTLLLQTGSSLAAMDLARQVLGESAARRIAAEACEHATSMIAEDLDAHHMAAFVEHLRGTGQITPAFIVRAACGGHIDLFAASLSGLSGLSFRRVRAILVEACDPAFSALCAAAKLPDAIAPLLLSAVRIWKDIVREGRESGGETATLVLERLAATHRDRRGASGDLQALLSRLSAQSARRVAHGSELRRLAA